jgi:hypothetical protein
MVRVGAMVQIRTLIIVGRADSVASKLSLHPPLIRGSLEAKKEYDD